MASWNASTSICACTSHEVGGDARGGDGSAILDGVDVIMEDHFGWLVVAGGVS